MLRDAVLHLLEDDPTLEPRDVIVMCPDIETFAPLIQATFGSGHRGEDDEDEPDRDDTSPPDLRVRLADRSLRQTNPVLGVVSQLLALADQRATASQLLDLAGREPVRRRFGFDDDDVSRMQEWVAESGIRWGFDAAHREPFKLGALQANTWRAGLDRILVGVAMTEERPPARRRACCRSTTWTAARSISPAGSPSSSTASRRRPTTLNQAQADRALDRRDRRRPPTRSLPRASASPGSGASSSACSTTSTPSPPRRPKETAPSSSSPTSGRCSPTGCAGDRRGRTSAPAT